MWYLLLNIVPISMTVRLKIQHHTLIDCFVSALLNMLQSFLTLCISHFITKELLGMASSSSWKLESRNDKDAAFRLPVMGVETRSDLVFVREQQTARSHDQNSWSKSLNTHVVQSLAKTGSFYLLKYVVSFFNEEIFTHSPSFQIKLQSPYCGLVTAAHNM